MLEGRPCLWNIYEKCYHSREAREKGFEEISRALDISVADIKAKITSLRTQLGRELAKTQPRSQSRFRPRFKRQETGGHKYSLKLRRLLRDVACVWPALRNKSQQDPTIGTFRLDYEYEIEYEYDFSILVCRLHIITSHTHLIPGAPLST